MLLLLVKALLVQGLSYGLPQARQPVLEQVVGGPILHAFHRRFLADAAGHNNEGNIQAALLQQLQRTVRVKVRQGVIREDEANFRIQVREVV